MTTHTARLQGRSVLIQEREGGTVTKQLTVPAEGLEALLTDIMAAHLELQGVARFRYGDDDA